MRQLVSRELDESASVTGKVDPEQVMAALPFGRRSVSVVSGGLLASSGIALPEMGDTSDQAVAVVAAITVKIDKGAAGGAP